MNKKPLRQELIFILCFLSGIFIGGAAFQDEPEELNSEMVYWPVDKTWGPQEADKFVIPVRVSRGHKPACGVHGPLKVADMGSFGALMVPKVSLKKNKDLVAALTSGRRLKLSSKDAEAYLPGCPKSRKRVVYEN